VPLHILGLRQCLHVCTNRVFLFFSFFKRAEKILPIIAQSRGQVTGKGWRKRKEAWALSLCAPIETIVKIQKQQ